MGSARGCAVWLADDSVAAEHLLLRVSNGGWVLETLDPDHRVFRDGRLIETAAIDGPLRVRLGDPVSGPLLELAPADSELRDSTVDFGSLPETEQAEFRGAAASFQLSGNVLRIGRDAESDVVVDDLLVSRQHAEIRRLGEGRYEAIDLRFSTTAPS